MGKGHPVPDAGDTEGPRGGSSDTLRRALSETDENDNPDAYRALQLEYRRLMTQRPDTKKDAS